MSVNGDKIISKAYEGLNRCESNGLCSPYTDKVGRQAWCGAFVEYCYRATGVANLTKYTANPYYVSTFWSDMKRWGFTLAASQSAPGDVIVFNWDGNREDDMGLVVQNMKNGTIKTIEGNTGNCVRERSRTDKIVGVARIPEIRDGAGVGGPGDPTAPPPPAAPKGMDYSMYMFTPDDQRLYEGELKECVHDGVLGWNTQSVPRGSGKKIQIWAGRGNFCLDTVTVAWDAVGIPNPD